MANFTVYITPIKLMLIVSSIGASRSPFSSTLSSSKVVDFPIPAFAKTWSIFPYSFSVALKTSSCSFQDETSAFKKGTDDDSGSGSGLTSHAKTLPPCLIIFRSVASPIPEDAPVVHQQAVRKV